MEMFLREIILFFDSYFIWCCLEYESESEKFPNNLSSGQKSFSPGHERLCCPSIYEILFRASTISGCFEKYPERVILNSVIKRFVGI